MYNFNGTTFTIVLHYIFPFCDYSSFTDGTVNKLEYSLELKLLETLSEKLNFKMRLLSDGVQSSGILRNGSWNGVMSRLLAKTVDVSLCDISISKDRFEAISFTRGTFVKEIAFISQAPSETLTNSVVTMPFEPSIWASFGALALCLLLTFKLTVKNQLSLVDIIISFIAISLRQPNHLSVTIVSSRARLLVGLWMLSLLTLSTLYSSVFYSILTVPQYGRPIDSIDDITAIAQTDSHWILPREQSTYGRRLLNAPPDSGVFTIIAEHLKRSKRVIPRSVENVIAIVEADPRNVVVRSRLTLTIQRLFYAKQKLHIGSESLGNDYVAFMLQKDSILLTHFNYLIQQFHEFGFTKHWLEKSIYNQIKKRNLNVYSQNPTYSRAKIDNKLSFSHLKSLFLILLFGKIISIIFFCSEIFIKLILKNKTTAN